jgi:hypothetical protein
MSNLSSRLEELPAAKSVIRRIVRVVLRGYPPRRSRKRPDKRCRDLQKKIVNLERELSIKTKLAVKNPSIILMQDCHKTIDATMDLVERVENLASSSMPVLKLSIRRLLWEVEEFLELDHGKLIERSTQTDQQEIEQKPDLSQTELDEISEQLTESQNKISGLKADVAAKDIVILGKDREIERINLLLKEKDDAILALSANSNESITSDGVVEMFKSNLAEVASYSGSRAIQKDDVISGFGNAVFEKVHKILCGNDKAKDKLRKKFELDKLTSSEVDKWFGS